MREIREYNMNGTIILGVDNGYGNVKTAHRVFPTGIIKCDSEPVLSKEYIEYDGVYYIIGEGHKGFVADKQEDDDTYILTLAAIAKELEARGLTEARIHLAVGLPLKWVQAQRESFKKYLNRERYVSLKYKKVDYLIEIVDCTVMPQGYAAVAENLKDFKGMNLLVDVGNGTMNVMYLNNGRPIESKSWTEKLGVNQCFIRIQNRIMDRTGTKLPDEIINDFLRYGDADVSESLELLISKVLLVAAKVAEKIVDVVHEKVVEKEVPVLEEEPEQAVEMREKVQLPKKPEEPLLLSKYPVIMELDAELKRRNEEIFAVEQERGNLEIELSECSGVFKKKQRKELQEKIMLLDKKVEKMKTELSKVLRDAGYANAAEFFTELFAVREEKRKYEEACKEWQQECVRVEIEWKKHADKGECNEVSLSKGRSR